MRHLGKIGTLFIGIALGVLFSLSFSRLFSKKDKLSEILKIIEKDYVDSINIQQIRQRAIPSILELLDPHSTYLTKEELANDMQRLQGEFEGIGISFNTILDTVVVERVHPGGPSDKYGLKAGDRILSVNNTSLLGDSITPDFIRSHLKGKRRSWADLSILRSGSLLRIKVQRGNVPVSSIDVSYMYTPTIGLIKLSSWSKNSWQEFMKSIQDLREKGARSFIVDLRDNMGGYMDPAIMIANEFLPKGELIVYSEGRNLPREDIYSDGNGVLTKTKFVILVNELSASASEIFAGAMQDHDRATIIGRRTFGKGLIQRPYDFADGSCLRLTVGRYFTPSGRSIQKKYTMGEKRAYEEDLLSRYESGEPFSGEENQSPNQKKYYTDSGRIVFSEYGIMPDIIVPEKEFITNAYHSRLLASETLPQFAFLYIDRNRKALAEVSTIEEIEKYFAYRPYIVDEYARFAAREAGIDQRPAMLEEVRTLLHKQIVAMISLSLIGPDAYYRVMQKENPTLTTAVECLEK